MFDAVVDLVRASAEQAPLLIVLEDLHWADASSLRLLAPPRRVRPAGAGARRVDATNDRGRRPGDVLVDAMAAMARAGAERVRLDGLDDASVGRLLDGRRRSTRPADSTAFVAEVTGGNPFFVLQYARLLAGVPDLDRVEPATLPVPDGIRDVLRQRVQRLPEDAVAHARPRRPSWGSPSTPTCWPSWPSVAVDECLDVARPGA